MPFFDNNQRLEKGDTIKFLAESKPKYKYDPRSILKRYWNSRYKKGRDVDPDT